MEVPDPRLVYNPTKTCLMVEKICDNHQDCPDDSDEVNCSTCTALYFILFCEKYCLPAHFLNTAHFIFIVMSRQAIRINDNY